jgi:hypothetical protein
MRVKNEHGGIHILVPGRVSLLLHYGPYYTWGLDTLILV